MLVMNVTCVCPPLQQAFSITWYTQSYIFVISVEIIYSFVVLVLQVPSVLEKKTSSSLLMAQTLRVKLE